jgi:fucose permease
MVTLLIALIYLAFIALGLGQAESLLGSAWPTMHLQIGTELENAGFITMIFAAGTIISSLLSDRITRRLGAGLTTAVGVLVLGAAIFGVSTANTFLAVMLWAVPHGLASGTIDAALNNYVARHYSGRYMSWLHCFWGVGAIISPYIMGYALAASHGWQHGYFTVSIAQVVIAVIVFASLPLWRKKGGGVPPAEERGKAMPLRQVLKIRGVRLAMFAFFAYCAAEATTMLWATSYLVFQRGIAEEIAARHASLFFWGIMSGRLLGGFISDKIGDRNMIRGSVVIMLTAIIMIALPVEPDIVSLAGLVMFGLGCATVYPSIIHATPSNFGEENSRAIIGVLMAAAYTGSTLMPPLLGQIARLTGIGFYPIFLLIFTALLLVMSEWLNKTVDKEKE